VTASPTPSPAVVAPAADTGELAVGELSGTSSKQTNIALN